MTALIGCSGSVPDNDLRGDAANDAPAPEACCISREGFVIVECPAPDAAAYSFIVKDDGGVEPFHVPCATVKPVPDAGVDASTGTRDEAGFVFTGSPDAGIDSAPPSDGGIIFVSQEGGQ